MINKGMKLQPFFFTFLAVCVATVAGARTAQAASLTTVVSGLNNPRGMDFDAQGNLYITESGSGGPVSDRCIASPSAQYLKLCAAENGSVIKVTPDGTTTNFITGLASIGLAPTGEQAAGPADFKFDDKGNGYLLVGLAGNPGQRDSVLKSPSLGQLYKVDMATGALTSLADLGAYEFKNNPDGTDLISNPYAMTIKNGYAYVVEGGGNDVLKVALDGSGIQTAKAIPQLTVPVNSLVFPPGVGAPAGGTAGAPPAGATGSAPPAGAPPAGATGSAPPAGATGTVPPTGPVASADDKTNKTPGSTDLPGGGSQGIPPGYEVASNGIPVSKQSVPTGITQAPDGTLTLSEYSYFPYPEGKARIWSLDDNLTTTGTGPSNSQLTGKVLQDGFTQLTGVSYDKEGNLYALQSINQSEWKAIQQGGAIIGDTSGSLIKIAKDGTRTTIWSGDGLTAASNLTLGPDGDFYISNNARLAEGKGSVIKIDPRAKVPEPSSVLGLVAIGALGASSMLKRKRKSLATIQAELV